MRSTHLIPLLIAPLALAQALTQCPILLDARIPPSTPLSTFDTANPYINPDYVHASTLKWSQILLFPNISSSRFDAASASRAVEVTISDASIFQTQTGFRRAGMQFASDGPQDASDQGVVSLHWSVRQDGARALNRSHEYLTVWHETAAYDANQFNFELGTIIGSDGADKDSFKVLGRANNIVYTVGISNDVWQNFAVTLDYEQNTLQVYYSKGDDSLEAVTGKVANNNSGGGQFQIGVLKKPTGTSDVVNGGFQETEIDEGQIYGGLFVEDSSTGCISL